jgi:hypothetical protein
MKKRSTIKAGVDYLAVLKDIKKEANQLSVIVADDSSVENLKTPLKQEVRFLPSEIGSKKRSSKVKRNLDVRSLPPSTLGLGKNSASHVEKVAIDFQKQIGSVNSYTPD